MVFVGGRHDIRQRRVEGKPHAVLMVESVLLPAGIGSPRDALLPALRNLDDFRPSQHVDRGEGDRTLPPRPGAVFASELAARRKFPAATDARDDEPVDRAQAGLPPSDDPDSILEILWHLAARGYVNIGHKTGLASQTHRAPGRLGAPALEPALRCLVHALRHRPGGPGTEALDRAASWPPLPPRGGSMEPRDRRQPWRTAREDSTRRLLVLQAAGWPPALRGGLKEIVGLKDDAAPIHPPGVGIVPTGDGPRSPGWRAAGSSPIGSNRPRHCWRIAGWSMRNGVVRDPGMRRRLSSSPRRAGGRRGPAVAGSAPPGRSSSLSPAPHFFLHTPSQFV